MFLNFDDNRPDTPRVPQPFTRLERVLLVVVSYQFLVLSYLLAPDSLFATPVKQLVSLSEPLRYVEVQPLVDRTELPKLLAQPSDLDRRAAAPEPVPQPENPQPRSLGNTPEMIQGGPSEPPRAAEAPRPVPGPSPEEAPPVPPRVPGGILGSALRNLDRYVQDSNFDNPEGGVDEQGPSIQFDSKGIDFGPWLRRFRAQVYRNWLIPEAARVMHGNVAIQMVVLRDGTIKDLHIIKPSGIEPFDTAAVTALRMSNPTMPLPDAYPGNAIDPFTVIFYYNEPVRR